MDLDDTDTASVEAFLAGRYATHVKAVEGRPPFWSVLNAVTHASRDHLLAMAAEGHAVPDARASVEHALARAALAATSDDAALRRLQQDLLLPIELEAIAREPYDAMAVFGLAATALAALTDIADSQTTVDTGTA